MGQLRRDDDDDDGFGWKGGWAGDDPIGDPDFAATEAARIRRRVTEDVDRELTEKESLVRGHRGRGSRHSAACRRSCATTATSSRTPDHQHRRLRCRTAVLGQRRGHGAPLSRKPRARGPRAPGLSGDRDHDQAAGIPRGCPPTRRPRWLADSTLSASWRSPPTACRPTGIGRPTPRTARSRADRDHGRLRDGDGARGIGSQGRASARPRTRRRARPVRHADRDAARPRSSSPCPPWSGAPSSRRRAS